MNCPFDKNDLQISRVIDQITKVVRFEYLYCCECHREYSLNGEEIEVRGATFKLKSDIVDPMQ